MSEVGTFVCQMLLHLKLIDQQITSIPLLEMS